MKQLVTFNSRIEEIDNIQQIEKIEVLSQEPQFFQCSPEFIFLNDAPIHHKILKVIQHSTKYKKIKSKNNIVIDSRVTYTMRDWYPSIPGWHCDSVPRSNRYSQPDLSSISNDVCHFLCFVPSTFILSETEFAIGKYNIPIDPNNVWNSVDKYLLTKEYESYRCKPGYIYWFDQQSLHRASPTKNPGWRLFFRLSFDNKPVLNKLRKQTQVYVPQETGW